MEEFALRYLVSGMYSLDQPDPRWFSATLRAFTSAYLSYIAVTCVLTVTIALVLARTMNRCIRTAGVTVLFVAIVVSPLLYSAFLDLFRPAPPPNLVGVAFIHPAMQPVLLVVIVATSVAITILFRARRAQVAA